jgi:adenylate cyclase
MQIGRELGFATCWKGAFARRLTGCITGQLVDTATGAHLWADRIDGGLDETRSAGPSDWRALSGRSRRWWKSRDRRAKRKPAENSTPVPSRGLARLYQFGNRKRTTRHCGLKQRKIEIEIRFCVRLRSCRHIRYIAKGNGWFSDTANEIAEVTRPSPTGLSWQG